MSTRIINLTPGLMTLPYPYRGAIGPGRGAIVSDDPATVLVNLGGIAQVEGVYRLDLTSEPGQAAYDPAANLPTSAAGATSGATPVTVATVAVPLGKTILVEAQASGLTSNGNVGGAYVARASFRNDAGVVSQIGSSSDDFIAEDDSDWTGPDFVISGTDVLVQVIGKAATDITWNVDYAVHTS